MLLFKLDWHWLEMALNWYSPFPLSVALESKLANLGLRRFEGVVDTLPAGSLLIYLQPHALLERSPGLGSETLLQALTEGYGAVASVQAQHRLMVDWRLEALEPDVLASWLSDEHFTPEVTATAPTPSDPLLVMLVQDLFAKVPELLDHYLDLELQAELAQTSADTDYIERLLEGLDADQLLAYWRVKEQQQQRLFFVETELRFATTALAETKAELEQSRAQLQQLEETHPPAPAHVEPPVELSPVCPPDLDDSGWQDVIDAHPLESHDPEEWLRYGAALMHRLEPGPQQAHQQQQAALAFIQARQAGASEQAVKGVQEQVVRAQLQRALQLVVRAAG